MNDTRSMPSTTTSPGGSGHTPRKSSRSTNLEPSLDLALAPITDAELRTGVVKLFDTIREWVREDDVDLVFLSARRLACLYQLLVEHGMEPITGCLVVSDRFLDVTTKWQWSNVVVVDDSVVLGSTLHRLYRDLVSRTTPEGISPKVRTAAIVVDQGQEARFLLEEVQLTVLHRRSSREVEKFSTGVVQALFQAGIPFFSDFPATREVSASLSDWGKWLDDEQWFVADVTAPLLSGNGRFALVQIPKDQTVETVLRRLFPAVARLVENFKLRSYVHVANGVPNDAPDVVSVRFVPIAMLRPATPGILDEALQEICDSSDRECPIPDLSDLRPQSKHRLVQMFASAALMHAAITPEALHRTFDVREVPWDLNPVALYFGDSAAEVLTWFDHVAERMISASPHPAPTFQSSQLSRPRPSPWLRESGVLDLLWQQRELLEKYQLPAEPDTGQLTRVGLLFMHGINSIFGYITAQYERPQRRRIAQLDSIKAYDAQYGDEALRVLNQGITLHELTSAIGLRQDGTSSWARSCLSLGIDIGNDLGIVVPDTRYDEKRNLVYRCYRMGETATIVDRPLPTAVWTTRRDLITKQAGAFPLRSFSEAILTHLLGQGAPQHGSIDELMDLVRAVLPGVLTERYDGTVTALDRSAGTFTADLAYGLASRSSEQFVSVMEVKRVSKEQRALLQPGSQFRWAIYERDEDGFKDSTSRIRMTDPPDLDLEKMAAEASALVGRGVDR
jgi:hypothetical protein